MSVGVLIVVAYVLTTRITRVLVGTVFRLVTVLIAVLVALALVGPARVGPRGTTRITPTASMPSDHLESAHR